MITRYRIKCVFIIIILECFAIISFGQTIRLHKQFDVNWKEYSYCKWFSQLDSNNKNLLVFENIDINKEICDSIAFTNSFNALAIHSCQIHNIKLLFHALGNCTALEYLFIINNNISSLDAGIGQLSALKGIIILEKCLESLPNEFYNLHSLEYLILSKKRSNDYETGVSTNISKISKNIRKLENLKHIDIAHNNLISLPKEFECLNKLEFLDLSNNALRSKDLSAIKSEQLKHLNLSSNEISNLKYLQYKHLSNLKSLYLFDNNISMINRNIQEFRSLSTLLIHDNRILFFPRRISNISKLRFLSIDLRRNNSYLKHMNHLKRIEVFSKGKLKDSQKIKLEKRMPNVSIEYF